MSDASPLAAWSALLRPMLKIAIFCIGTIVLVIGAVVYYFVQ